MNGRWRASLLIAACALCGSLRAPLAAAPVASQPSYTADQAWRGRLAYYESCAECHGGDLAGNIGPALAGSNSELQWLTGKYVYGYMTAMMPHGEPGTLPSQDYVDIMAFLYQQHRRPAGSQALTTQAIERDASPLGGE